MKKQSPSFNKYPERTLEPPSKPDMEESGYGNYDHLSEQIPLDTEKMYERLNWEQKDCKDKLFVELQEKRGREWEDFQNNIARECWENHKLAQEKLAQEKREKEIISKNNSQSNIQIGIGVLASVLVIVLVAKFFADTDDNAQEDMNDDSCYDDNNNEAFIDKDLGL